MTSRRQRPLLLRAALFIILIGLAAPRSGNAGDDPHARGDRALIVVGLPGDDSHAATFKETAKAWRDWLTGPLQFPSSGVLVLFGDSGEPALGSGPATREAITAAVANIRQGLAPEGRLWVFFLGHANVREKHAYFHLPGPDLRDDDLGTLFDKMPCREQVFWVTMAASGWFLPGLSAPGRIVITATTRDVEFNETEFPHALAEISRKPVSEADQDGDGKESVWEIFGRTAEAVAARFKADDRAPTEHALIDDNGDKAGTEWPDPTQPKSPQEKSARRESQDGELARKTFLRIKVQQSP
jgi:hypothetical protein